jgi:integrase
MHSVPYLVMRKRSAQYRRDVPTHLVKIVGKTVWKITLGHRITFAQAVVLAEQKTRELDALITALESGLPIEQAAAGEIERMASQIVDPDEYIADARDAAIADFLNAHPNRMSPVRAKIVGLPAAIVDTIREGGRFTSVSKDLKTLYAHDKEKYGGKRDEAPIKYAVDRWVKLIGNTDFVDVRRFDVEKFVTECRKTGITDETIKRRIVSLQGINSRARIARQLPEATVWQKLQLELGNPQAKRLAFHRWHLGLIEDYIATTKRTDPQNIRLARIMRALGLGPSEAAGILPEEVDLKSSIPTVLIRENRIRSLKTDDDYRARLLPLTGDALAVMEEAIASPGQQTLFVGSFNPNTHSANVNALIRNAGVPKSPRLVGYSFRHGFQSALGDTGMLDTALVDYSMGHAQNKIGNVYQPPYRELTRLRDAFIAAEQHRGNIIPQVYTEEELPPAFR